VSLVDEPKSATEPHSKLFDRLRSDGPSGTRYKLVGEIARGGMGAILEVWDAELRRKLAMKVILGRGDGGPSSGDTPEIDPRTLGRFLEEAQITGQLDHPGIVPVHEVGLDSTGRVYFTMRLVRGKDLRTVFGHALSGHEGWNQVRALNVLLRVCEAVAFAHSKEVIHRDLKPANVMVGRFGEVVVMDWGVARVLGREDRHDLRLKDRPSSGASLVRTERRDASSDTPDSPLLTMDGAVLGTPSFMPPEQARGELERLGPHSDVYSIGAMLYQLLTGVMPYVPKGARVSPRTILMAVLHGPPPSVESIAPRTPPELVAICERAMAREIGDRYATTKELAADLQSYLEGRVVAAYETGTWAETRKWVLRNKELAGSLAAAFLAIVAGLIGFGLKTREANANAARANTERDRAVDAELLAEDRRGQAERNREEAVTRRVEAEQKAAEVLRLSAIQDYEDLVAEADTLWPPYPDQIAALEAWIGKAQALVDELPVHRAKRTELLEFATLETPEERETSRRAHPDFARFSELGGELDTQRLALASRRDGVRPELPSLPPDKAALDAGALHAEAWLLVDSKRTARGRELEGLVLALAALEKCAADDVLAAKIGDTVAWGYFALGLDAEAIQAQETAVARAEGTSTNNLGVSLKSLLGVSLESLREQSAAATSEAGLVAAEARLASLDQERALLEERIEVNRVRTYPETEEAQSARWWNGNLTKLIESLEGLVDLRTGLLSTERDAVSPEHGWSVPPGVRVVAALELSQNNGPYVKVDVPQLECERRRQPRSRPEQARDERVVAASCRRRVGDQRLKQPLDLVRSEPLRRRRANARHTEHARRTALDDVAPFEVLEEPAQARAQGVHAARAFRLAVRPALSRGRREKGSDVLGLDLADVVS